MDFDSGSSRFPTALKLVIAGGFGVGKTTFVGNASEIEPLSTEEIITVASAGIDDLEGAGDKSTTTVAMDYGRITLPGNMVLYLFGTPGQERFWFMWDELTAGALGAVVLADTNRLDACFAATDYFERRGVKFVVAVNEFDGAYQYSDAEVHAALDLDPEVPVVSCDARNRTSSTKVLVRLVEHLIASAGKPRLPPLIAADGARDDRRSGQVPGPSARSRPARPRRTPARTRHRRHPGRRVRRFRLQSG